MLNRAGLLALAICASGSSACILVEEHHTHGTPDQAEARRGPPPHAPAHGYRNKQAHGGSVDLIFDSDAGVYVVVGWPDHYWYRDHYYRWADGHWMIGVKLDGDWADCSDKGLPPGLAKKHGRDKHAVPASRKR